MDSFPRDPGEGVLVTALFTDIVDSTATLQVMGDTAWRDLLLTHNTRLRDQLDIFRGREVKTTGDGFLAVFDSATRAVRCGAAMARSARKLDLPIRVGVHTGEVELVASFRSIGVHGSPATSTKDGSQLGSQPECWPAMSAETLAERPPHTMARNIWLGGACRYRARLYKNTETDCVRV